MKVMFYCQRVLGISHLVRSAEIARALWQGGDVVVQALNMPVWKEAFEPLTTEARP